MATVTSLEASTEHPHHVVVRVDGKVFVTVPTAMIARLGLTLGASVDLAPPLRDGAITTGDDPTYDRALGLLAYRARSAHELRRTLVDKGESAERVEAAMARLQSAGLIDDEAYARSTARVQVAGRARSVWRTEHELRRRGVAPELAAAAVREVLREEGTDEASVAVKAAEKKLRTLTGCDPRARRDKLYGYLARQGYSMDAVRHALRVVLDASPPDGAQD